MILETPGRDWQSFALAILCHRTGRSTTLAIALQLDLDPFEVAGGEVVVELDVGGASQIAGDELGQRLADDQADRLVAVAADQRADGPLIRVRASSTGSPRGGQTVRGSSTH